MAVFLLTLQQLGAKLTACSDNAYAADDDVVAYLKQQGMTIFARARMSREEYFTAMEQAIAHVKDDDQLHLAEDGCDITQYMLEHHPEVLKNVTVATEQTTCGVNIFKRLFAADKLAMPVMNINHCFTKQWFDNNIGIQQSLIHGLTSASVSLPGKTVTIFGFGPIGQGAAHAMQASGARVNIVESDIIALMQADMAGYTPVSARHALETSDICLTATGCIDTIPGDMIKKYARSGLMLGNIGHGTKEYDLAYLEVAGKKAMLNEYIDAYTLPDNRVIRSFCQGFLVNFMSGCGNMPRVMSLTFTLTVLAHLQAVTSDGQLTAGLHNLDRAAELDSARRNFPHLTDLLYRLDDYQLEYLVQA
jgi:adenosylhomocysteinase